MLSENNTDEYYFNNEELYSIFFTVIINFIFCASIEMLSFNIKTQLDCEMLPIKIATNLYNVYA